VGALPLSRPDGALFRRGIADGSNEVKVNIPKFIRSLRAVLMGDPNSTKRFDRPGKDVARWLRPRPESFPLVTNQALTIASAIGRRYELPVHRNKTLRLVSTRHLSCAIDLLAQFSGFLPSLYPVWEQRDLHKRDTELCCSFPQVPANSSMSESSTMHS